MATAATRRRLRRYGRVSAPVAGPDEDRGSLLRLGTMLTEIRVRVEMLSCFEAEAGAVTKATRNLASR